MDRSCPTGWTPTALRRPMVRWTGRKIRMSFLRAFGIALEGLALNKVRSFLTMLGLIIGVAAVIIMMAVSHGAEAEVADQINSLGANLIMIQPSFSRAGVSRQAG